MSITAADIADAAEAIAGDDPRFASLLEQLPEHWALVSADSDGLESAAAFIRAAYGAGYQTALENRLV